jgi:hypothetical protein
VSIIFCLWFIVLILPMSTSERLSGFSRSRFS